jgi:uncharacterized membrane protein
MKLDAETRLWIYRVIGTVVPLLVTLGITTEGVAGQIMNIVAAILSIGSATLAAKNITK